MTDAQLTALRAAIRQALVECYASHAAMLRGLAGDPSISADGPTALKQAAARIEQEAKLIEPPPSPHSAAR